MAAATLDARRTLAPSSRTYSSCLPLVVPARGSAAQLSWRLSATRRESLAGLSVLTAGLVANEVHETSGSPPKQQLGFEGRVSEFTLSNGLHFIVLERHVAPVISCHTYAKVGAFVEQPGSTGIAHLLEHMAFKGTPRVGSKDWAKEAAMLADLDSAFYTLRDARSTDGGGDSFRVKQLEQQFKQLQSQAAELLVPNAYGSLLQSSGAVALNASTSQDNTRYYVSLPANKLELWFALESERFQAPTFRSLYPEKEVVAEERRLRQENSPIGALTFDYLQQALGNNYRRPVIGYTEDVARMGTLELVDFFERYYHPRNLTISIVGDVDPAEVQRLAERYFGGWQAAATAEDITISRQLLQEEPLPLPPQGPGGGSSSSSSGGVGEIRRASPAGPLVLLGYYRPTLNSREGVALEVAVDVLSGGRSSRMLEDLVQQGRCLSASALAGYPGSLHAGLALVSGIPVAGGSLQGLSDLLQQQLDKLMEGGPSQEELARVKKASRAGILGSMTSNSSMAAMLAAYHANTGSWRGLLEELQIVEDLKAVEVAAVAQQVFQQSNRFTGLVAQAVNTA